ncbi:MAG: trigger factor [Lachnospiraceae bacterium]|nr:trigger factor [Lachnospiraceae bacterium]
MKAMKNIVAAFATLSMMAALAACGQKEYTIADLPTLDAGKYVTLPEYKGLQVSLAAKTEITDDAVDYYIQTKMNDDEQFHDVTTNVEDGDMVNISYVGMIDDVAFDGGTANDQLLVIGSDSYIDGFEDGLIGASAGETVSLNLTFPENYSATDLAGKDCVFTVTVNYVVADLTDENVALVDADYTEAAAYKAAVKELLQSYVDYQYEYSLKSAVASQLLDGCTFEELPESLLASFREDLVKTLEDAAAASDTTMAEYMANYYGVTEDNLDSVLDTMAEQYAQEGIALQAIADIEGITVTDEEVDTTLESQATEAGKASVEEYLGEDGDKEDVRTNLMYNKVYDLLIENAVITEG